MNGTRGWLINNDLWSIRIEGQGNFTSSDQTTPDSKERKKEQRRKNTKEWVELGTHKGPKLYPHFKHQPCGHL